MKDKTRTILLVEDELIIALEQAQTIKQFGYEVVTVNSGEKAVGLVGKNEAISLILMDIDLGKGIDGPETAQRVLAIRNIPIVFLTSHAEREMVEKVRGITRYGYVIKNSGNFVLQSSIEMAFDLFEAHEKSRESEERYRLLADNASDSIWMMGLDGIFTYHSPAVEKLRGYTPEEANRISLEKSITPASLSLTQRIFDEERAKPVTDRWADRIIEIEVYRKDGTSFWAEASIRAIRDKEGRVIGLQGSTRDITKRKRAEGELILKSLVLDQVKDHVSITDLNGTIIYVNQTQVDILGRSRQEIVGQSTKIYGEDAERGPTQREIIEKTLRDGFWQGEIVNYAADSSEHIMALRTQVVHDSSGKVIALCGSATDITERKRAEEALKATNELFSQFVKHSPIYTFIKEVTPARSIVLQASDNYQEMIGIHGGKMIGKTMSELFPAEFAAKITEDDWAVVSNGKVLTIDEELYGRSYTTIKFPVIQGDKIFLAGYTIDITERKRAEDLLRSTQQRLGDIITNLYAGVLVISEDDKVEQVNQAFCDLFDFSGTPADLRGLTSRELVETKLSPHVLPAVGLDRIHEIVRQGKPIRNEEFAALDGRFLMVDYIPLTRDGQQCGRIWHYKDITEQKLAEAEIKSLLAEKELILKEVHHRIKNSISIMIGILSLQADRLKDPVAIDALHEAISRTRSIGVLYDKLYNSANLNEMSTKDYLTSLVNDIVGNYPTRASVKIKTNIDDFVLSVKALSSLGIIVNELVTNAMKYAFSERNDGVVTVSVTLKGNRATIVIGDNGNGIPATIDFAASTGFGLQLVRMLAQQIGATIKIERGRGSRFVLEFEV